MSENSTEPVDCCFSSPPSSVASAQLNLYKAFVFFVFSVPIFFAFILLFLFYMFYLRRQEVHWSSFLMRTSMVNDELSRAEMGLKKEVREMLPIIIYKESFSIKDTQCSVCLGDYQAEDRIQQIPACGHTFHMECIDHWLANHSTCPLCRISVLSSPKASNELPDINGENVQDLPNHESSIQTRSPTEAVRPSETTSGDVRILQSNGEEDGRSSQCVNQGREYMHNVTREHIHGEGISEYGEEPSNPENGEKSSVKQLSLTCHETQAVKQMEPIIGDVRSLPKGEEEGGMLSAPRSRERI